MCDLARVPLFREDCAGSGETCRSLNPGLGFDGLMQMVSTITVSSDTMPVLRVASSAASAWLSWLPALTGSQ